MPLIGEDPPPAADVAAFPAVVGKAPLAVAKKIIGRITAATAVAKQTVPAVVVIVVVEVAVVGAAVVGGRARRR